MQRECRVKLTHMYLIRGSVEVQALLLPIRRRTWKKKKVDNPAVPRAELTFSPVCRCLPCLTTENAPFPSSCPISYTSSTLNKTAHRGCAQNVPVRGSRGGGIWISKTCKFPHTIASKQAQARRKQEATKKQASEASKHAQASKQANSKQTSKQSTEEPDQARASKQRQANKLLSYRCVCRAVCLWCACGAVSL